MSETLGIQLLADQIARRMAHRWAQRKGLGEGVAEDVLDEALPILWAQRVERVPIDLGELYAKAIALVSVQKGRKIQYSATVLERAALAEWAARRSPRSQFVGDDGSECNAQPAFYPLGNAEMLALEDHFRAKSRRAIAKHEGYPNLSHLSAYHTW